MVKGEGGGRLKGDFFYHVNPVLGLSLEGDSKCMENFRGDSSKVQGLVEMEHDLEKYLVEEVRERKDHG